MMSCWRFDQAVRGRADRRRNLAIIQLDHRASRRQDRLAEANYQTAMLDLRRQLNISLAAPLDVVGDLDDWQWAAGNAENLLHLKCPQVTIPAGEWPALDELAASRPTSWRPGLTWPRARGRTAGQRQSHAGHPSGPLLSAPPIMASRSSAFDCIAS